MFHIHGFFFINVVQFKKKHTRFIYCALRICRVRIGLARFCGLSDIMKGHPTYVIPLKFRICILIRERIQIFKSLLSISRVIQVSARHPNNMQ